MDNDAARTRAEVRDWLAGNPRVHVHITPTSGSWLNLVEVWFGIIERQAIGRGRFTSVHDLMTKIRTSGPAGTTATTRSSGPSPPKRSSTRSTANVTMSQRHASRRLLINCRYASARSAYALVRVLWTAPISLIQQAPRACLPNPGRERSAVRDVMGKAEEEAVSVFYGRR